nr:MAG TPA: hypothetical protein [Caudoviricetes sp.]
MRWLFSYDPEKYGVFDPILTPPYIAPLFNHYINKMAAHFELSFLSCSLIEK